MPTLELPGLALRAEAVDIALAKFDLELRVANTGFDAGTGEPGNAFEFVYAVELFDAMTIETLADRFLRVLAAVTTDPRILVRDIDARTEHERRMFTPAVGGQAARRLRWPPTSPQPRSGIRSTPPCARARRRSPTPRSIGSRTGWRAP